MTVEASKSDLNSVTNKLKDKENDIAKALAKKLEQEQETDQAIQTIMEEETREKEKMCSYYDIERFDIDYLSDAVTFLEREGPTTRGHAVSVTGPGDRRSTVHSTRH